MADVVFFSTYKLKKGVSVSDFSQAVDKLIEGHISRQKGYVSFKLFFEGESWADYVMFDSMEHLNAFLKSAENNRNELAEKFYSFLDFDTCKSNIYSVEKSY